MTDWPVPVNVKELRSFVGLRSYYRKSVRDFETIDKPLHKLAENNSAECDIAFSRLKELLVGSTVLTYPDPNGSFFLDTDANGVRIGAVLSQEHNGVEKVIDYFSRTVRKSE